MGTPPRKKGHAASDLAGALRAPPSPVGVAFNPYEDDMEKERAALAAKFPTAAGASLAANLPPFVWKVFLN